MLSKDLFKCQSLSYFLFESHSLPVVAALVHVFIDKIYKPPTRHNVSDYLYLSSGLAIIVPRQCPRSTTVRLFDIVSCT
jgi:hypothetical protein